MNIFNRIIVIILLIFIIAVSALGILNTFVKWTTGKNVLNRMINSIEALRNPYAVVIFVLIIIFCIFLLVLEFYRRKSKTAVVAAVKEGTALITLNSIANQLKDNLATIEGTKDLNVKVVPKSKGVIINIFSKICLDCNIPSKMQEIIKTATDFAVNKLGLKVVKTNLTIINLTNVGLETAKKDISANEPAPSENKSQMKTDKESDKNLEKDTKSTITEKTLSENNSIAQEQNEDIQNGDGEEDSELKTDNL